MRVLLFAFGKLKVPGVREGADYYSKLLGGYLKFEETELKALSVPDKSVATRKLVQQKEGELLLEKLTARLSPRSPFYLLDETGKSLSTTAWATQVREWESGGTPEIALCIGSSLGFSAEIRSRARGAFSLGPQTLPHELARVVLLEQLYRAWSVTKNHPYHNEGR